MHYLKMNEWASHSTIIYSRKQIHVHDNYHIKNNNVQLYTEIYNKRNNNKMSKIKIFCRH